MKQNRKNAGLTLIEVLVVMGITVLLISLGLFVSMDSYRGYIFRSERTVLVSVLEKARNRAMNNIHQTAWGACYDGTNKEYIIFRGATCTPGAATNDVIPANPNAIVSGLSGIIWSQLSGKTTGATIILTEDSHISTISINEQGTINW